MKTSESIKEIATALSKAQAKMGGAVKDSSNPFFKSKYADLASVREACIKPLNENGISIVQPVNSRKEGDKDEHYVETLLIHSSGEYISSGEIRLVLAKTDMPALGSAITYARRYQLQSIVGLSAEDDDGNAAVGHKAPQNTSPIVTQPGLATPSDMGSLIGNAKRNNWTEQDVREYISKLGLALPEKGLPPLNDVDFKDVFKHFSTNKKEV